MFVPIRDATIIAGAKAATIRQWAKRGKVVAACNRHTRHVEYEIASLIIAEAETRKRENRVAA